MAGEGHAVQRACRITGVSHAGYYIWRLRAPSERAIRHAWLLDQIITEWFDQGPKPVHESGTESSGVVGPVFLVDHAVDDRRRDGESELPGGLRVAIEARSSTTILDRPATEHRAGGACGRVRGSRWRSWQATGLRALSGHGASLVDRRTSSHRQGEPSCSRRRAAPRPNTLRLPGGPSPTLEFRGSSTRRHPA